jgi:hypothetical protein
MEKTKKLWIKETWVSVEESENDEGDDTTKRYGNGNSDIYETMHETPGELFKALQKEHGKCISKVYQDREAGSIQIGWVFEKKAVYSDTKTPYKQETWVEVHDKKPETKTTFFYTDFER